jgi:hypothetical protein
MHVQIELFGGPEDGRQITIPVGAEGAPISPLPVPSPTHSPDFAGGTTYERAWYEKDHQRTSGVWVYRHSTVRSVHRT